MDKEAKSQINTKKKSKQQIWLYKLIRYGLLYVCIPLVLDILIEIFSRKSVFAAFRYIVDSPLLFVFNMMIIMLTLSIAMFFKREIFVHCLFSVIWLVFGIVNFVVLQFRVTPFSAVDFSLIESAIEVSGHYLSVFNVAMIILAIIMLFMGIFFLFRVAPVHEKYSHRKIAFSVVFVGTLLMAIAVLQKSSDSVQALSTHYTNIQEAYENYGFAYCFTNSILDTGIAKPEDYSSESIMNIADTLKEGEEPQEKPNIILFQLESFFDVSNIKGLKFSKDPLPNFHRLQKQYSSGLFTVPTVGAGTVNTEFEVLTGIRQHDFGVSEYPYKTVLKTTPCESVAYNLKDLGYATHAVHNNTATFYGRNKVFENLGFETFTSMEYMNGLEENPNGWVKDDVLTSEILKTLDSTPNQDFIMTIGVQSHGKYDQIPRDSSQKIKVKGAPAGKEDAYQYYVNQIYEVDQMIGTLVDVLGKRDEKTVVVFYGDHLPSLDIVKEQLKNKSLYQTQYVVWDNMGLAKKKKNVHSYEVYPMTLKRLGMSGGMICNYHQQKSHKDKEYLQGLTELSYDLLYGDNFAYSGNNPYQTIHLQMGLEKSKIQSIEKTEKGLVIKGVGFTTYSHVFFNGDEIDCEWVASDTLLLKDDILIEEEEEQIPDEDMQGMEPKEIPNAFVVEIQNKDGLTLTSSRAYIPNEKEKGLITP